LTPGFSERDDRLHYAELGDRWWATETCWFSFHEAERRLGGWLYVMVRPNIGTVAGGAWVWDDTAYLPWEVPYSANYTSLRFPRDQDLDDITLPTGVTIKALEPLTRYELGYSDGDRLQVELTFDAIMPPAPLTSAGTSFGSLSHFDQFGRVKGEITLHGERIPIDCLSMRDRSWGPRPEHRPRRTSYVTGIATEDRSFFVTTSPNDNTDLVTHGFQTVDGELAPLRHGRRRTVRDPHRNWVVEIDIEGEDNRGRWLRAHGVPLSRIVLNRHTSIDSNSLIRWEFEDGTVAYGEDQDLWPVHEWSAACRAARTRGRTANRV
jgi:hypothetical protein